ncbi:MAG TPA: FtsX-like permease family protein, partial [Gemmatimonadaceae bacterium]|nr:FtsX-like permease family protein [Gemmatimonadaceae bacterium]
RLRKLLLTENLLLALMGAAVGVVFALAGVRLLVSLAARYSPRASEIGLDGGVLAFTLGITVAVALLLSYIGALPKEGKLGAWISSGANRMSSGSRGQRLQRGLVVAQVAVSVILLTGAGLLTRTMLRLSEVDTGLKTENVLSMEIPMSYGTRTDADARALYDRMKLEVGAIPGVTSVGVGSTMPLRATQFQLDVKVDGRQLATGEAVPHAEGRSADANYFRAGGIPLLQGREFATTDQPGSQLVVILNQTAAKKLFPDKNPIGQRIAWTGDVLRFIGVDSSWRTVVGVVGDTKDGGLDAEARNVVFVPFTQQPVFFGGGLVIRAQSNPASLIPAATRLVRGIVPHDPIQHVETVADIKGESVAPRRLNAALVSSFGGLAVIIAAVGIAGVLAFSVSSRTNEIGIRMSLGADSGRVQRMILWEGGVLLIAGLVIGVGGAYFATRLFRGLLFGVAPHDPVTLAIVAAVMGLVGVVACWMPALRAARIDPAVAIRRQ